MQVILSVLVWIEHVRRTKGEIEQRPILKESGTGSRADECDFISG